MSGFIQALYNVFQTGKRGLVPAPSDAEVLGQYVLCADARWRPGVGSGTVVSVGVSGSNGIEVANSPITTAGVIALSVNAGALKTHLGLNLVENTALSTWAGSGNITTLGTIAAGSVPAALVSGLGTVATSNDYNDLDNLPTLGTAAATDASAYQPIDADLTAIAALTTTAFGRGFLDRANLSAGRAYLGLATSDSPTFAGLDITGGASVGGRIDAGGINTDYHLYVYGGGVLNPPPYVRGVVSQIGGTLAGVTAKSYRGFDGYIAIDSGGFAQTVEQRGISFLTQVEGATGGSWAAVTGIASTPNVTGTAVATSVKAFGSILNIAASVNSTVGYGYHADYGKGSTGVYSTVYAFHTADLASGFGPTLAAAFSCPWTAAANRYGLYVSGAVQNYLAGELRLGSATDLGAYILQATGNAIITGTLTTGASTTVLTDAAGKILSAALNTVAIAQGGTGATTDSGARTALGLGTMATQAASAVAITGGTINGTTIGASTASTGAFTTLAATIDDATAGSPTTAGSFTNSSTDSFGLGGFMFGARVLASLTNPVLSTKSVYGLESRVDLTANANTSGEIIGSWARVHKLGNSAHAASLIASASGISLSGAGNVTKTVGSFAYLTTYGSPSGVIAEHVDFWAGTSSYVGSGSVTNLYGVKIDPHGDSWATNAYGVFIDDINGATGSNYAIYTKAGLVRFGGAVSAPSLTLTADLPVTEGGTGASDAAGARTNLGLVIGTNVQAYSAKLLAIAGLSTAADRLPYFTGASTAAVATFTAGGRALVNSAGTASTFPYFSSSNTVTLGSITAAGRDLLDDASNTDQRTTLGLGTMATQAASAVAITGGTLTGTTINNSIIGGTTPAGASFTYIRARSGVWNGIQLGADSGATTLTDATSKAAYLSMPHYTNAEEPVAMVLLTSLNGTTLMRLGGGDAVYNTVTQIDFYTAASNITTTGTRRGGFNAAGVFDVVGDIDLEGVIKAGSSNTTLTDATGKILSAALNPINGLVIGDVTPAAGSFTTLIGTSLVTGNLNLLGASAGYSNDAKSPMYLVPVSTADSGSALGVQIIPEMVAVADSDQLYGTWVASKITSAGFNGLTTVNLFISGQTLGGGGTIDTAYQLYMAAGPTATNRFGIYQAGTSDKNQLEGVTGLGIAPSSSTQLCLPASTTAKSSLRIPHGAAPSSPVNGDMWSDTTAAYIRINGVTKQLQFV